MFRTNINSEENDTVMPIIEAFRQSDTFGRLILLILFALSIFAWSTILRKYLDMRQAKKCSADFYDKFSRRRADFSALSKIVVDNGPCPFYEIYTEAQQNMTELMTDRRSPGKLFAEGSLSAVDMEVLENALDRTISRQTLKLEESLNLLATSASVSPFLGLLGTVWGVLIAFQDMSRMESAQIGAVTRGISGALVTTVVGLLVAIPSLVMYNYMVNSIKRFETEMENFSSELLLTIERQYGTAGGAVLNDDTK